MTIKEAQAKIQEALDREGPYSHNIISLVLMGVALKYGNKRANKMIDEFDLEDFGWKKEPEEKQKKALKS